jgi:hypothetical protein
MNTVSYCNPSRFRAVQSSAAFTRHSSLRFRRRRSIWQARHTSYAEKKQSIYPWTLLYKKITPETIRENVDQTSIAKLTPTTPEPTEDHIDHLQTCLAASKSHYLSATFYIEPLYTNLQHTQLHPTRHTLNPIPHTLRHLTFHHVLNLPRHILSSFNLRLLLIRKHHIQTYYRAGTHHRVTSEGSGRLHSALVTNNVRAAQATPRPSMWVRGWVWEIWKVRGRTVV